MNKKIRKTLSVFLSTLMIVSCWSLFVPNNAVAEGQGTECTHKYAFNVVAPTCHSVGYTIRVCKKCEVADRIDEVPATDAHNWEKVSEERSLSCLECNMGTYRCTNKDCTETKKEPVKDENGNVVYGPHEVIPIEGKAATCTEDGYTAYTRCVICSESKHSEKIPAIGHVDKNMNGNCDVCNFITNPAIGKCDCFCHSKSSFERFLFDFANFFWKLFKVQKNCQCGVQHW